MAWAALRFQDPGYEQAINATTWVQKNLGRYPFRPLTSRMLGELSPARGSMPQEIVQQMYQLRDAEIAALMRQRAFTVSDIDELDCGAKSMVADLLYGKCDEAVGHALLHDVHSQVRACAVIAHTNFEAARTTSTLSTAE